MLRATQEDNKQQLDKQVVFTAFLIFCLELEKKQNPFERSHSLAAIQNG